MEYRGSRPLFALKRRFGLLVLVTLLIVGMAVPASAYVEESGYRDCGAQQVKIKSRSYGFTSHFRNGTELYISWMNYGWENRYSSTFEHATVWAVGVSGGALDAVETYSYCGPMPESP